MTIEFGNSDEPLGRRAESSEGVVGSEFAEVSVRLDTTANSPRLRLEDVRSGRVRYLDALELETIIWLPEERLTGLLDPSHSRWRGEAHDPGEKGTTT